MSSQLSVVSRFLRDTVVSKRNLSSEIQKTKPISPGETGTSETPQASMNMSSARKRMFVLAGIYKNTKDIPDTVSAQTMARNMDKMRVRASMVIMALCALGAISSIALAKGVVDDIEEEKERKK